MITLTINGQSRQVDTADDTPLLWVIREQLQMTGTKFGCGAGLCGACTVHLDGTAVRSCQTSAKDAAGKKITTIEGLGGGKPHALQVAWEVEQVPHRHGLRIKSAYFNWSATLSMPALAQTSSFSPPGAPETPTAPITSSPTLIGRAPWAATTLVR